MKLYEEIIDAWDALLAPFSPRSLPVAKPGWPDSGSRNMVLRGDMAFELGEDAFPALGATAVTVGTGRFGEDQILLCGPDLPELTESGPFARLTVAAVKDVPDQGSALYTAIKKIDFVRYHVNPQGFMTRISAIRNRESARVSREALAGGLNFSQVGSRMLTGYHENPNILAVRLVYITDPAFPFPRLEEALARARDITRAIDHAMTSSMTDCNVCGLKKVCDQVEGIRQLHFGKA